MRVLVLAVLVGCADEAVEREPVVLTIGSHSAGIVLSDPPGIRCGRCAGPPPQGPLPCPDSTEYIDCAAAFELGTRVHVTLTQSAVLTYICGGAPAGTTGCTIEMTSSMTITVNGQAPLE